MSSRKHVLEPNADGPTSLSRADRELIFREATKGFVHRYGDRFAGGMSDGELWKALQEVLGIFGGSGGPDRPSITYQGSGLKIWGGWQVINHVTTAPLFSGGGTVAMAREIYGISDPTTDQMTLF